jgi:NAD(P)-dependent dehydrogenase (short-subunit alcohol dehydrogenase family)
MMPIEFDITGKVVFITGAGRGIGKGIAQVLAEAGADIALNALTPKYVEGVAAEIAAGSQRRVVPVIADVTKPGDVRRAVESVLQTFGRIDVLVNALGDSIRKPLAVLPGKESAAAAVSDDELSFIMNINLTEALLCTRTVGPHMLARRSGKVINIASWAGHRGGGDMVLYTTAKTALAGFTRAQAREWAPTEYTSMQSLRAYFPTWLRPAKSASDRRHSAPNKRCRFGGRVDSGKSDCSRSTWHRMRPTT